MKTKQIQFLVYDWNTNGTNDVALVCDGEIRVALSALCFGIDIVKYEPEDHGEYGFAAVVPMQVIRASIAVSPVHSYTYQWQRLVTAMKEARS